jgi:uncharacterized protein (DUF952 family)
MAHVVAMIYKIFRDNEWAELRDSGETAGAPIDLADGFIHFSTARQVHETADKYFADVPDLWLAAFDEEELGEALKWEPSRGGALFPHLFRNLKLSEMTWCVPLPVSGKGHDFPDDLV